MSLTIDFSGKNVVVIGGTSGINLGVACGFARHGANVAVASRSQDKIDAAVAKLNEEGAAATLGFSADVRDAQAIDRGVDQVHAAWGDLDVVVSGAAGNFPATANGMSANAFKSVVDIDLLGTFHVMKAIYPRLTKPGASVINISAPQALLPMHAQSHVCAAKAGVDMITRTLALEWGPAGVRINSIVPGPIDETEGMLRLAPTPAAMQQVADAVPMKRLGTVDDIANACMLISSEVASFITGAVVPVDGGWMQGGAGGMSEFLAEFVERQATT